VQLQRKSKVSNLERKVLARGRKDAKSERYKKRESPLNQYGAKNAPLDRINGKGKKKPPLREKSRKTEADRKQLGSSNIGQAGIPEKKRRSL